MKSSRPVKTADAPLQPLGRAGEVPDANEEQGECLQGLPTGREDLSGLRLYGFAV